MSSATTDAGAAIAALVDAFDGDATSALLAIADAYGIAVHYHDRKSIEARCGTMSDAAWDALKPRLNDYDSWIENSGAYESIDYWLWALTDLPDDDHDVDDHEAQALNGDVDLAWRDAAAQERRVEDAPIRGGLL